MDNNKEEEISNIGYRPSKKDAKTIKKVYTEFLEMIDLRNQSQKYFNDRTLKEFINDSQLRLNSYVPTRESQGKEDWQSNFVHPVTKNKFKAILAAVALDIPQTRITAQNEKQRRDATRAEIMKNLVKFSYDQDNKEEQIFFEGWEAAEKGTVIVYDGYLKGSAKRKVITSYDPETGDIETEEQEVETDNQCVNFIVPLMNLYIKDIKIFDIQKQPSLCWVEMMNEGAFDDEFGKYPKAKNVKRNPQLMIGQESDTFFSELWKNRISKEEPIEVLRYYNKSKDEFIIIANGVIIFESPLILGKKKKWYPFAKTVFDLFATNFFYGNSLPNSLMGEHDVIQSLFNMAMDKTYKSMGASLVVGNVNKDDLDLEDQNTMIDTKIYVQDINQIKPMPLPSVSDSEFKMIDMISRGLDLSSVDANQQGVPGRGVTAREVVIANENAKKLKGIMYMFLTSLWIQKMKLRIMNVLTYYTKPKVENILGEKDSKDNKIDEYQSFLVNGVELSNGMKGTMGIEMVGDKKDLPDKTDVDVKEYIYKKQSGENYEHLAIVSDYLDDWIYDIKVESDSIYQKESGLTQLKIEEKLRVYGTYFPQLLQLNTEKLFKDTVIAYEDDPDEYELSQPAPQMPPGMPGEAPAQPGAELATAGQANLPKL